jgi:hypothetical protein
MSSDSYSTPESTIVDPLMPDVDAESGDWLERVIMVVATVIGVLVVAAVAVVFGAA